MEMQTALAGLRPVVDLILATRQLRYNLEEIDGADH
jgi:hypothetical protein